MTTWEGAASVEPAALRSVTSRVRLLSGDTEARPVHAERGGRSDMLDEPASGIDDHM
jgi:hypothetical protein